MLVHDLIKIKLTKAGYLMNYPYHMISDKEMCDAFMKDGKGYFYDTYSIHIIDPSLHEAYETLKLSIEYHLNLLKTASDDTYVLPDWVYSYMLGYVISIHSDPLDIHDLITPLGVDNIDDIFDDRASVACYEVSKRWLRQTQIQEMVEWNGKQVDLRPPTMFGEPHIIKSIRLSQVSPV